QAARRRERGGGARPPARHPRPLSRLALPDRRRRRGREPQGLSDRREPGADDPERRLEPAPLPGGMGSRDPQALADLLRGTEPRVHADLRTRAPLRLRGLLAVHAPVARADRVGPALRRARRRRRGAALPVEGRDREPRDPRGHGDLHAGLPEAAVPARRAGRRGLPARGAGVPPALPVALPGTLTQTPRKTP